MVIDQHLKEAVFIHYSDPGRRAGILPAVQYEPKYDKKNYHVCNSMGRTVPILNGIDSFQVRKRSLSCLLRDLRKKEHIS